MLREQNIAIVPGESDGGREIVDALVCEKYAQPIARAELGDAGSEIDYIFPATAEAAKSCADRACELAAPVIGSAAATHELCLHPETRLRECGIPFAAKESAVATCSADCLTDGARRLRFVGGRSQAGSRVTCVRDERIDELARRLNSAIEFRGPWGFGAQECSDGTLAVCDVWAHMDRRASLARNRGVNLPLLCIYDAMGVEFEILENDVINELDESTGEFSAGVAFETVYCDFDDCLIIDGQANKPLVEFLRRCTAAEIRCVLLTRHAGDINASLAQHSLTDLFDNVVHITDGRSKSEFIQAGPSVVIDDSHGERKSIRTHCPNTLIADPNSFTRVVVQ